MQNANKGHNHIACPKQVCDKYVGKQPITLMSDRSTSQSTFRLSTEYHMSPLSCASMQGVAGHAAFCIVLGRQNFPDKIVHRNAIIALAPRTDQCIPDCFKRLPITFLHPASMTPLPTKKP